MNTATIGRDGEARAALMLEAAGMRIIGRNFRSRRGEIDLVAIENDTLVFVEVKTWARYGIEDLEYSVTAAKRGRIIETAKLFLAEHREYNQLAVRFDLVFIGPHGGRHLASAFMERV